MFKGIIFDLDQTLIDSSISLEYRGSKKNPRSDWKKVFSLIDEFKEFGNIIKAVNRLKELGIKVSIVTSSPSGYCKKVLNHWNIHYDYIVAYHDVNNRKPHKEPSEKAINLMGLKPNEVIAVGDDYKDIQSYKDSGCLSIGAAWGIDKQGIISLKEVNPDEIFYSVREFLNYLAKELKSK
ncbi:HAD family hydrolase [Paraclostridium bifermentans]|uniref:HAD family hydrolase n=1 Tax=Paraclostridium bifermentans TaxID=1490 RepID=UPI00241C6BA4|nr:HAD-IA family hydrolase [Paraclostridium bifermentans]